MSTDEDEVTFYLIVSSLGGDRLIKAWTSDKKLAKMYLEFHACPDFHLKQITDSQTQMKMLSDENFHDDILIANIKTRDRKKDYPDMCLVSVPLTNSELTLINGEADTFFGTKVSYHLLSEAVPYLKTKYRKALNQLLLGSVMNFVVHNRADKIISQIYLDELLILFRFFPTEFG